ncbi:MAG: hypothetical protein IPI10_17400 [Bacteroidetes bacterium]|nr:hypothetical protein [Bacteroidota bacterium]
MQNILEKRGEKSFTSISRQNTSEVTTTPVQVTSIPTVESPQTGPPPDSN